MTVYLPASRYRASRTDIVPRAPLDLCGRAGAARRRAARGVTRKAEGRCIGALSVCGWCGKTASTPADRALLCAWMTSDAARRRPNAEDRHMGHGICDGFEAGFVAGEYPSGSGCG